LDRAALPGDCPRATAVGAVRSRRRRRRAGGGGRSDPRELRRERDPLRSDLRGEIGVSGLGDFVHLQVRSHYSLMGGASSREALCEAAVARGRRAMACTDVDGLYGAVRFREIALSCGLRPILGAEVTAADARRLRAGERATLLVKTPEGYARLCRIL